MVKKRMVLLDEVAARIYRRRKLWTFCPQEQTNICYEIYGEYCRLRGREFNLRSYVASDITRKVVSALYRSLLFKCIGYKPSNGRGPCFAVYQLASNLQV